MQNTWTMEEARSDFNSLVNAAHTGEPQFLTDGTQPALVLLTAEEYELIKRGNEVDNMKFSDFLVSGPKGDIFPDDYSPPEIAAREVEF